MEMSNGKSPPTKTNYLNRKLKSVSRPLHGFPATSAVLFIMLSLIFIYDHPPDVKGHIYMVVNRVFNHVYAAGAGISQETKAGEGCICPTGMNMLYIGIPNPINVAIPGVPSNKINIRIEGADGSIKEEDGHYSAHVKRTGSATIYVGYNKGGYYEYKMEFRVRNLPKPEAKWGNLYNDGIPKPRAAVGFQTRVLASLGESFAFSGIRYTVTRYQFIFVPKTGEATARRITGNVIPQSVQRTIMSGSKGDRILVDQIRATGPGGERPLSPLFIELN